MTSMVERMARAMFEASPFKDVGAYEDQSELYRRTCRVIALAALRAMEEPTDVMRSAGYRRAVKFGGAIEASEVSACFNDMINAAIQQAETEG